MNKIIKTISATAIIIGIIAVCGIGEIIRIVYLIQEKNWRSLGNTYENKENCNDDRFDYKYYFDNHSICGR